VAVRSILQLPERVLKGRAAWVGTASADDALADLVDTMRASPACVGLAAPQIGLSSRIIAVDVGGHPKTTAYHGLVVLIDPIVMDATGAEVAREGCMSVPDFTANVKRALRLVVRGRAPGVGEIVIASEGFEARALQHEIDHLDGLLILDRVDSLATDVFRRKIYR
jgi:peptide deformylase